MDRTFPPPLEVGSRVWTTSGYRDHGPLEGPKIDIAPNMGGTITRRESRDLLMETLLYTVEWDNGQVSKHYPRGLFCIGRFQHLSDFEAAIQRIERVQLTLGPQGGFRQAKIRLLFDDEYQEVEVHNRNLWVNCLERIAVKQGSGIDTIRLPPKSRKKGTDRGTLRDQSS